MVEQNGRAKWSNKTRKRPLPFSNTLSLDGIIFGPFFVPCSNISFAATTFVKKYWKLDNTKSLTKQITNCFSITKKSLCKNFLLIVYAVSWWRRPDWSTFRITYLGQILKITEVHSKYSGLLFKEKVGY
jgi:hypothetical protein